MKREVFRDAHLRVEIRVRNNAMVEAREQLGMSQAQFARAAGLSVHTVNRLETLADSPRGVDGEWKESAVKIADFHGLACDDLWAGHVIALAPKRGCLAALKVESDAEGVVIAGELKSSLATAMRSLTTRESVVLTRRFAGEVTLDELGDELGVSAVRAAQVEARALAKLRHPSRSKALKPFVEDT